MVALMVVWISQSLIVIAIIAHQSFLRTPLTNALHPFRLPFSTFFYIYAVLISLFFFLGGFAIFYHAFSLHCPHSIFVAVLTRLLARFCRKLCLVLSATLQASAPFTWHPFECVRSA
jgi:hypothetical protein